MVAGSRLKICLSTSMRLETGGGKEDEDEHLDPGAGTVRSREEDPGPEEDMEGDNTNYRGSVRRA
jgi:hypothetical protein